METLWATLPVWFRAAAGFAVGAATGSFVALVIDRVPRGIGISGRGDSPPSRCVCGRELALWENLPIVSYLALRGRARCCGAAIPAWYLGAEVMLATWWAVTWTMASPVAAVAAAVGGSLVLLLLGLSWERTRRA
jgi:leader peptidase (prepilin peptidase) / N-methyltransferase